MTKKKQKDATNPDASFFTPMDLSLLERDELVKGLNELLNVFQIITDKSADIQNTQSQIAELEGERDNLGLPLPIGYKIAIGVIDFIYFFMAVAQDLNFVVMIILLLLAAVCLRYLFKVANEYIEKDKLENLRQSFTKEHIVPLQNALRSQKDELQAFLESDYAVWANTALPERYLFPTCIRSIIDYVESRRADTLKEALNLYEEEIHRRKMETMQEQIVESTRKASEEANKQTALFADLQQELRSTKKAVKTGNAINLLNFLK